jgi:hypothetical protein
LGNDELNQQSFDTQLLNNSHHDVIVAKRYNIGQELAENEMTAARFNVKRKAWIAAAERSQWVIFFHKAWIIKL